MDTYFLTKCFMHFFIYILRIIAWKICWQSFIDYKNLTMQLFLQLIFSAK